MAGEPFRFEVEAVAAALLEGETLTGQEVRDVLRAAADERFGKVEFRAPRMVVGKSSHNVGYAWSRAHVPDHPDVVGTARIIRDVMSTVRREMAGDTYHDCLFLGGDPVADNAQDASATIIDAIGSHGGYSLW